MELHRTMRQFADRKTGFVDAGPAAQTRLFVYRRRWRRMDDLSGFPPAGCPELPLAVGPGERVHPNTEIYIPRPVQFSN